MTDARQERQRSQEEVAASVRMATMLMEAYRTAENPSSHPFEGDGVQVSVTVNVHELIASLQTQVPTPPVDHETNPEIHLDGDITTTRHAAAARPVSTAFEDGIRVASSSRDARPIRRRSAANAAAAASQAAENPFGTVTMREYGSSQGNNGGGAQEAR